MKTRTRSETPTQAVGVTRQVRIAVTDDTWRRFEALVALEGIRRPELLGRIVAAFVADHWKDGGPNGRAA